MHGTFSKIDYMIGNKQASSNSRKLKSIKHVLRSQWLEMRNQSQGKNSKTVKYMENDQHVIKQ